MIRAHALLAVALFAPPALPCDPFAALAAGYSRNYASEYWDKSPEWTAAEFPGFLGRVSAGIDCGALSLAVEHTSSIETRMDRGYEAVFLEWRIGGGRK